MKDCFKTEEEMYKHFISFGVWICGISYMDGSKIGQRINPKKDVLVSYEMEGGPLRAVHSKHKDIRVCIADLAELKDTLYEQGKLRHSRYREESAQDSWGHSGRRYKEDNWNSRSYNGEERQHEDQASGRTCRKSTKTKIDKDQSRKRDDNQSEK